MDRSEKIDRCAACHTESSNITYWSSLHSQQGIFVSICPTCWSNGKDRRIASRENAIEKVAQKLGIASTALRPHVYSLKIPLYKIDKLFGLPRNTLNDAFSAAGIRRGEIR